jgi:hypothetical protein
MHKEAFIQKWNGWTGAPGGTRIISGTGDVLGNAIAVDLKGHVYLSGGFQGTAHFGAQMLTSYGGTDAFVSELDSSLNFLFSRHYGGTLDDQAVSIAVDKEGFVDTTGWFATPDPMNKAHFSPFDLVSDGPDVDMFVHKERFLT